MLTIEALQELGVDTKTGLDRCLNKEDFYFKMIKQAINANGLEKLEEALNANDLDAAFHAVHDMKSVTGTLGLTPIYEPVVEMTEHLRFREQIDYFPYFERMRGPWLAIRKLANE